MSENSVLKLRFFTANLIGLALIAAVFVSAGVVEVVRRLLSPFAGLGGLAPPQIRLLKAVLVVIGLGTFFFLRYLNRFLPGNTVASLFQQAVVTFALCESVALYGLILFFLGGNPVDFYLFMALSLFYFWLFYPKYQHWEAKLGLSGNGGTRAGDS